MLPDTKAYSEWAADLARYAREVAQGNVGAFTRLRRGFQLQQLHDLPEAVRDYTRALDQRAELPEVAPALRPPGAQRGPDGAAGPGAR